LDKMQNVFLIKFHPMGDLETLICGVTNGSKWQTTSSPFDALPMKASNSCKARIHDNEVFRNQEVIDSHAFSKGCAS